MLFYIELNNHLGIWANKDKALDYISEGYHVFKDEEKTDEFSEEEIESDDSNVTKTPECKKERIESSAT